MKPVAKLTILGIGLLALIVISVISTTGDRAPGNEKRPDPSAAFQSGTPAQLVFEDNDLIPIFMTQRDLWECDEFIIAKNKTALAAMLLDKRSIMVPAGTKVILKEFGAVGARQVWTQEYGDVWVRSKTIYPIGSR